MCCKETEALLNPCATDERAGARAETGRRAVARLPNNEVENVTKAIRSNLSTAQWATQWAAWPLLFAALLWVPRVDPVAVALGFSALVVALIIEGIRWGRHGGG